MSLKPCCFYRSIGRVETFYGGEVGLSPFKKIVNCLIESPLKMTKSVFYLILNAVFVLKIFQFLSRLFGYVGKTA